MHNTSSNIKLLEGWQYAAVAFDLAGTVAGSCVADLLIGGFTGPAMAMGGPLIVLVDHLAQKLLLKLAGFFCGSNTQMIQTYGFMIVKPVTYGITLLLAIGLTALFGASFPLINVALGVLILTVALFATQVGIKMLKTASHHVPCLRDNTFIPPSSLVRNSSQEALRE